MKALWARLNTKLDFQYRIGMRVVKTTVSVLICLMISLLVRDASLVTISAVSAIVTLRTSSRDTVRAGLLRFVGTLIGGLIGLACVKLGGIIPYYTQGLYVLVIPLMMLLDLYICNVLRLTDASAISSIVVVLVATHANLPADEASSYALQRVFDTLIGITVATVVNILIYPRRENAMDKPGDTKSEQKENAEPGKL